MDARAEAEAAEIDRFEIDEVLARGPRATQV